MYDVAAGCSRTLFAFLLFAAAARSPQATAAQAASPRASNPWLGKWSMNLAKSTYTGAAPKSATHWFVATADGMTQIIEQVAADGRRLRSEVTARIDGKDYPVAGDAQRDSTRAFRRIDRRTMEVINKTDGKVTSTIREIISPDGKTRTATATGRNARSPNVLVFDRQ